MSQNLELDEERKEAIWKKLIEQGKQEAISRIKLPNEKSTQDFAQETKLTERVAKRTLEKCVVAGKMTKREATIDGHKTLLYCPVVIK